MASFWLYGVLLCVVYYYYYYFCVHFWKFGLSDLVQLIAQKDLHMFYAKRDINTAHHIIFVSSDN